MVGSIIGLIASIVFVILVIFLVIVLLSFNRTLKTFNKRRDPMVNDINEIIKSSDNVKKYDNKDFLYLIQNIANLGEHFIKIIIRLKTK